MAVNWPVPSTFRVTLSGMEVTGAAGSSKANQNSVAEKTDRSWALISPMPM